MECLSIRTSRKMLLALPPPHLLAALEIIIIIKTVSYFNKVDASVTTAVLQGSEKLGLIFEAAKPDDFERPNPSLNFDIDHILGVTRVDNAPPPDASPNAQAGNQFQSQDSTAEAASKLHGLLPSDTSLPSDTLLTSHFQPQTNPSEAFESDAYASASLSGSHFGALQPFDEDLFQSHSYLLNSIPNPEMLDTSSTISLPDHIDGIMKDRLPPSFNGNERTLHIAPSKLSIHTPQPTSESARILSEFIHLEFLDDAAHHSPPAPPNDEPYSAPDPSPFAGGVSMDDNLYAALGGEPRTERGVQQNGVNPHNIHNAEQGGHLDDMDRPEEDLLEEY